MDPIELYDGTAPGSEDWTQPELRYSSGTIDTETVANVSSPTITPVLPADGTGNGSAVIIAPGGPYFALSIQSRWRVRSNCFHGCCTADSGGPVGELG